MAGRVDMASKRTKKGEYVSNEQVGIEQAPPFIHALFGFTARADKEQAMREKESVHRTTAPAEGLARSIKAMSLFPSIYDGAKKLGPN
jgi:hypothetical protein